MHLLLINLAILISGRGSNMESILKSIHSGYIKNVIPRVIISNNRYAQGIDIARSFNIPVEVINQKNLKGWDFDRHIYEILSKYGVTSANSLICLAGFMRILSGEFIKKFPLRIMNIHPSLLPSFPGLHAHRQALDYGVKISGCTVHFVDENIDTGPIILQKHVYLDDDDSEETLSSKILESEHEIYIEAIKLYSEGRLFVKGRKVQIR